ncbi:hypothetical protein D3C81_774550 [compost metagenome]
MRAGGIDQLDPGRNLVFGALVHVFLYAQRWPVPGVGTAFNLERIGTAWRMVRLVRYGQRFGTCSAREAAGFLILKGDRRERQCRVSRRLLTTAGAGLLRDANVSDVERYRSTCSIRVDAQRLVCACIHGKLLR